MDIISLRLKNQHLIGEKFDTSEEVVSHFGAVQAQDYPAAKWGLGLRLKNTTDQDIEKAYNDGRILRTHIMRPTWHFVCPEDLGWIQELTSPQVKKLLGHYNRKLGLDEILFKKTNAVIVKALKSHNYLTRQELKKVLSSIGIQTDAQRLAHIIMWAELDALICSGPLRQAPFSKFKAMQGNARKGKQFTYALLDERASGFKKLSREEALAKLCLTYVTSHGPAQLRDFSWWSGLSMKDAAAGLDFVKTKLTSENVDGKVYYFIYRLQKTNDQRPKTLLLSVYDEYFIGYTDRKLILQDTYAAHMAAVGNALLTSLIIMNGKVEGTWKRKLLKDKVLIKANLFRKPIALEKQALNDAADAYAKFLGLQSNLLL